MIWKIVIIIQRKWQSKLAIDKLRMGILQNLWNERVAELVTFYERDEKKHSTLLKRLRTIDMTKRNEALKNYYMEQKNNYIKVIFNWKHNENVLIRLR